ncbi:MAG: hypothetical protein GEU73_08730 [Chloroflexi bacterium]|nr:hypothetical protein [Chloroflexota bacterium]
MGCCCACLPNRRAVGETVPERVRGVSLLISLGFLIVAFALGYWQLVAAADLLQRSTNPRIVEEDRRIIRGEILDRNGEVLASSEHVGEIVQRNYPYPPLAHVVGYASTRHGKAGLEAAFDPILRGSQGTDWESTLRNALLPTERQGSDIVLTIDLRLQRIADEVLGDRSGAIVALDVGTGEVLALASHPSFDPNTLDERWEQLAADPSRPFVNRALDGQYVPGSVFKIITAGAALDLGIAQPDERHRHEGDLIVEGFRIRNTNHPQLTELTFAEEFAWSCNPAFALTGLSLGFGEHIDFNKFGPPQAYVWEPRDVTASVDRFREYADRFGIGKPVPFDLATAAGRISSGDTMTAVGLASTAFGQGDLQVTPLQMALVAATVPNGGHMPVPYLVSESRGPDGHVSVRRTGPPGRQVIRSTTASQLNQMMKLSVETAYARPAQIPGIAVGGKTGTAEVGQSGTPHAWFVGYAPADRSGVAVAVIMENRGSGTEFAAPAGQRVLEAAMRLGY